MSLSQNKQVRLWVGEIINSPTGFVEMERNNSISYADRECAIGDYVLESLANPDCEGSGDVLNAIIELRKKRMQEMINEFHNSK